jgi:hypothetical protein
MRALRVFDDFLPDPEAHRRSALAGDFRTYVFPEAGADVTYHGIATPTPLDFEDAIVARFPTLTPTLSFFRRAPAGQIEPEFIHSDLGMGDWTAILYLNHAPPKWDGTAFWRYLPTGEIGSTVPHERTEEGQARRPDPDVWRAWRWVSARFNRALFFPATYFHSRAIFDNWTADGDDRLVQVVFGKGVIE